MNSTEIKHKVLFVSSGNSGQMAPLVKAQLNSLLKTGMDVDYFLIKGKGISGYLSNIPKLRNLFKKLQPDIVHAHFSFTAFAASFALPKKMVVSLMGSDLKKRKINRYVIRFFYRFFWHGIIVKSQEMYDILKIKEAQIIPNGVDFEIFRPIPKIEAQNKLNWDLSKKNVLFAANPQKKVKNFPLAKNAVELLDDPNIELHFLTNVSHFEMPFYFNAADVVLLTSDWEGSPNVIKEALACNRPIVSTDCGDVRQLLEGVNGGFVAEHNPQHISEKIRLALEYTASNGREIIVYLNERLIAERINQYYRSLF